MLSKLRSGRDWVLRRIGRALTGVTIAGLRKASGFQARQGQTEAAGRLAAQADRLQATYLTDTAAALFKRCRHDEAEVPLRQAIALDPANLSALKHLVVIARCRGEFAAATEACRSLVALAPADEEAAHTLAVLTGRVPERPQPETAIWPVPFMHRQGFLSTERRDWLMDYAVQRMGGFETSTIVDRADPLKRDLSPTSRSSRVIVEPAEVAEWFVPLIKAAVPKVIAQLRIDPFPIGRIEPQLTVSHNGDFYKSHHDNVLATDEKRAKSYRRLSFIYYFCRQPQPFSGGQLRIYDTSLDGVHRTGMFSAIEPIDNSAVFFRSRHALHEVMKVHCPSNAFGDGRFTINGWVHTADTD